MNVVTVKSNSLDYDKTKIWSWIEEDCKFYNGHFVLKSGKHTSDYICCDPLFTSLDRVNSTARALAYNLPKAVLVGGISAHKPPARLVRTVIAPAVGGIMLGNSTALYLPAANSHMWVASKYGYLIRALFADKQSDGGFGFERLGFAEALEGEDVLVVEDATTTGESLAKTIDAARQVGANVVAASVIVNRGKLTAETFGVEYFGSLFEIEDYPMNDPDDCPMCAAAQPIATHPALGHGRAYQLQYPDYVGGYILKPTRRGSNA